MPKIENITIDGVLRTIEYKETHEGDRVWDKNGEIAYTADIWDADDLNWIISPLPLGEDCPNYITEGCKELCDQCKIL